MKEARPDPWPHAVREWAVVIADAVKEPAPLSSHGFDDLAIDGRVLVLRLSDDVLNRGEQPSGWSNARVTEFRTPCSALPPVEVKATCMSRASPQSLALSRSILAWQSWAGEDPEQRDQSRNIPNTRFHTWFGS